MRGRDEPGHGIKMDVPNRVTKALKRVSAVLGSAGIWPRRLAALEIRGRRSGPMTSFPLAIAEYDGERYL